MQGKFNWRLEMVEYEKHHSKNETIKAFKTTKTTLNKWLSRYKEIGLNGLIDETRAPHNQWKKCELEFEEKIIKLRKQTKNKYGARTLITRFALERSENCINRIIREHPELRRKKKTKHEKRNDLWSVKKLMKAFEVIQVDVKELMDMSNYYVQQWKDPKLPKYEITARDVKTGATWVCLADSKEATRTSAFISMLIQHLIKHGFDVKKIAIQTDNGTEFHNLKGSQVSSQFEKVCNHFEVPMRRIPPAAPTFNSDVETFHRLVEDEFYSIEQFKNTEDMNRQLYTHMIDFNYIRTNSNKDKKSPIQLLREDYPSCDENVLNFPIVNINEYLDFYFDLFNKMPKLESFFNPEEYSLFHGSDPDDLEGGHHVSVFHIFQCIILRFFAYHFDI